MYGINSVYVSAFWVLVVVLQIVIIATQNSKYPRRVRLSFLFIVLFFFSAFRAGTVGGDLDYYLPHFHEVYSIHGFNGLFDLTISNFEPGYTLLCWLISRFSDQDFIFLAVTSCLSLLGPFYLVKKYSTWPCISILIYILLGFYTNTYNNVRQSIAISVIFFSIPYIISNRPIKFLLIVSLATTIHASAVVFTFAYLLKYLPISIKSFSVFFAVGFAASFIVGTFVVQYLGELALAKYEEFFGEGKGQNLLIIYICFTIVSLYFYMRISEKRESTDLTVPIFLRFMAAASVIQIFSLYYSGIVRLTYYFYIPIIILLPNLISCFKSRFIRNISFACMLIILFVYMSLYIYAYVPDVGSNSQAVIPYKFCF